MHLLPTTPGLQGHWPPAALHVMISLLPVGFVPTGSQLQGTPPLFISAEIENCIFLQASGALSAIFASM